MHYDFDQIINRRDSDSNKWRLYDEDVLPLWVADMDFVAPDEVVRALQERAAHGLYGYARAPKDLPQVIQERLERLYGWRVQTSEIMFLPGVVSGFNLTSQAVCEPGDEILVEPPIYPPMLSAPKNAACECVGVPLVENGERYERDLGAFERAITERSSLFLLCNPHNPTGRVFEKDELERLAEVCLRHDVVICSDEIHCDIVLKGQRHVPIAAISPEIAAQTVTIFAPSKTFNVPGLSCSVGVVQNPDLLDRLKKTGAGIVPHVNLMGYTAALAAFRHGQQWLDQLLVYVEANCDYMLEYLAAHMPAIKCYKPEGTFLAWLDCRQAGIPGNPHKFFLEQARVAVNDGLVFGQDGEGFVRLNFACPRATLTEALERMRGALEAL